MDELGEAVWLATTMLRDMDADLVEIVLLSLQVSLTAVILFVDTKPHLDSSAYELPSQLT